MMVRKAIGQPGSRPEIGGLSVELIGHLC